MAPKKKSYEQRVRTMRLLQRGKLASETPQERELRLQSQRECRKKRRLADEEGILKLKSQREYQRKQQSSETAEERYIRCLDKQSRIRSLKEEAQVNKERVCCLEEEIASLKRAITLTYGAQAISSVTKNLNLLQKNSSIVNVPVHKIAEGIITKVASNVSQNVDPLAVASTSSAINENCIQQNVLHTDISRNNSIFSKNSIKERRIIDVKYFFNKLKHVNKHSQFGCSLNDIIIIGETKRGICTSYHLQCELCNYQTVMHSEYDRNCSGKRDLNIDMIEVMLSLNCDFDGINRLLDKLCLPSLSAKFFDEQLNKLKKISQKTTSQSTDSSPSCIMEGKSPETFRKSSALKPASLTYRELGKIPLHQTAKVPQIKTDQRANSLATCSENNKLLAKTSEQNLPSATCETSIKYIYYISPKPANQQTFIHKNLLQKATSKDTQKEPRVITLYVQKNMSSASGKSKNLHQNDSVGLLLAEDKVEIKEENATEDESELVAPDQMTEKQPSNELIVSQEQTTLNMVNIKQEIDPELNNECNLPLMDFNNMQLIDKESKIVHNINLSEEQLPFLKKTRPVIDESEVANNQNLTKLGEKIVEQKHCLVENCTKNVTEYADQAFTVLPQQKEIKSYENRMIVIPNQIKLHQSGAIHEDTRLVEHKCLEKKNKGHVTDFDNLREVELPIKKVRTANGQKNLLSVYERNGDNLCKTKMNNVADTKEILMFVANNEKKFFESRSESNNFAVRTSAATTLDGKNMYSASFQCMPQCNKNECVIYSQVLPNPANGLYQDVSGASSKVQATTYKHLNSSNNDGSTYTSGIADQVRKSLNLSNNEQPSAPSFQKWIAE